MKNPHLHTLSVLCCHHHGRARSGDLNGLMELTLVHGQGIQAGFHSPSVGHSFRLVGMQVRYYSVLSLGHPFWLTQALCRFVRPHSCFATCTVYLSGHPNPLDICLFALFVLHQINNLYDLNLNSVLTPLLCNGVRVHVTRTQKDRWIHSRVDR